MSICQFISEPRCTRPASVVWPPLPGGEPTICLTHFRIQLIGTFGEQLNPPWTKQQALDVLINMDDLDPDVAAKQVAEYFDREKPKS